LLLAKSTCNTNSFCDKIIVFDSYTKENQGIVLTGGAESIYSIYEYIQCKRLFARFAVF
jgi:hypothetical protein